MEAPVSRAPRTPPRANRSRLERARFSAAPPLSGRRGVAGIGLATATPIDPSACGAPRCMARLLVSTVPLTGHVNPMRVLVRALVERGHEIHWYAASKFAAAIEATGARFWPMRAARDWDDADVEAALPSLRGRRGLSRAKAQLHAMFLEPMPDRLEDLGALVDALSPDALLSDAACLGAALLSETRGLPWITLGVSPLIAPSVDTGPFGSALPPARWAGERARNRLLNWAVLRVLFADVNHAYRRGRVAAGLPAGTGSYFDVLSPELHLQPTIPAFEYPRRDMPRSVQLIGALLPRPAASAPRALPPFWAELSAAAARGTPIVLVTQGTLAVDARELLVPALRGLADEPVLVVATSRADFATLGLARVPANARVAPYIPYEELLPIVSVMVTNGGYNGAQFALAHGVPVVAAGGSEDKPEIAARVAWSGLGLDLRTGRPTPRAVRRAVRRVLDEPGFRTRARELSAQAAQYDGPARGAALIEALIGRNRPC